MAITIHTSIGQKLLDAIKAEIDANKIQTWAYDKDDDFTHTATQWKLKAWLRPTVSTTSLVLKMVWPKDVAADDVLNGIYQGRFVEMLVTHFPKAYTSISVTTG